MNIFIYSDESGVFDYVHNKYYVFGGIIVLGDKNHDDWRRKYASVEKIIRKSINIKDEIKATVIDNKYKDKIFRALNKCHKFAGIIEQNRIIKNIWNNKKDKQRYLDYVYKISVKRALKNLIDKKIIIPEDVKNMAFHVDEHSTATNGRYELREGLEQEFKNGTYNFDYSIYFPPLFKNLTSLTLDYCNSAAPKNRLIRAADIVANKIYYCAVNNKKDKLKTIPNLHYIYQP